MRGSSANGRGELAERLRARRSEIEREIITRVYAISNPGEAADPIYAEGLRAAVGAAIDYGLAGIDRSQARAPQIPAALLAQARVAARNGVTLDTVLRRYFAGYAILGDFLIEQGSGLLDYEELKRIVRSQAALLDRLLAAVSNEYSRESESRPATSAQRRVERVERLLNGELLDTAELAYELDSSHLGLIASGARAEGVLHELAAKLDVRSLLIPRDERTVWAWFGSRRPLDPDQLLRLAEASRSPSLCLAVGEPGEGLAGWRFSHRQAAAALPIAQRGPASVVHYADVALLASVIQDDLLAMSLRQLYLAPLENERDGGIIARETLCAYFAAGRNVASAAAALRVSRQAVNSRLRTIENALGRQLSDCASELEVALRTEQLQPFTL